jgi:limonene-1,2-epoxide hydrolase
MPFIPELFSFPALTRIEERRHARLTGVPFFDGLMTGELDALIGSFAGEPEVHQPVRGRIKGASAFGRFVTETTTWITERGVTVEDVDSILASARGVEEFVLHVEDDAGPIELPIALAADLDTHARMTELRIYFSRWPLSREHGVRPPLLQPDPDLQAPDVVGEYHRALTAGDIDAVVAAFEPDGYVREPLGGASTHRGADELRAFYERLLADGGGTPLELCAMADDGRACALEYNVVAGSRRESPPGAGIAVHVRGDGGRLAAVRIYDDVHPPVSRHLTERPGSASRDGTCT